MRGVEGALTAKGHVTLFGHLFFGDPDCVDVAALFSVTLRALKMIDDSIRRVWPESCLISPFKSMRRKRRRL